jgi:hypothetical protein
MAMGIAYDKANKSFWISDAIQSKAYRISFNGTTNKVIPLYDMEPGAVAFDGSHLWIVDLNKYNIIKIDTDDGTMVDKFKAPAESPTGIAVTDDYLYIADKKRMEIYQVDKKTYRVLRFFIVKGKYPFGLAVYKNKLWSLDFLNRELEDFQLYRGTGPILKDTKKYTITYRDTYFPTGKGKWKSLKVNIALPENRPGQKIINLEYPFGKPSKIIKDQYDQKIAVFNFSSSKGGKLVAGYRVKAEISKLSYSVNPSIIKKCSIPEKIKRTYLSDKSKYDLKNEIIKTKVKEVVGDEKNLYWKARKLYDNLTSSMKYARSGGWNAAPVIIKRKTGSCSEYTFTIIALFRAAQIPSRYVGAVVRRGEEGGIDNVFHRWAEIYMPCYGWIPVDANAGNSPIAAEQGKAFASLFKNKYLITTVSGGGSSHLKWDYNSNYTFTAKGPVVFNVEKIAVFEPNNE